MKSCVILTTDQKVIGLNPIAVTIRGKGFQSCYYFGAFFHLHHDLHHKSPWNDHAF